MSLGLRGCLVTGHGRLRNCDLQCVLNRIGLRRGNEFSIGMSEVRQISARHNRIDIGKAIGLTTLKIILNGFLRY